MKDQYTSEELQHKILEWRGELSLPASRVTLAYLSSRRKNNYHHFFWVPRDETRWGNGGPLQAVAAPLTPRPRGTIYEALPLSLKGGLMQNERRLSMTL